MELKSRTTKHTRQKLMKGFWELYKRGDINKITVSDICSISGYERTTFYRYFNDDDDILDQVENEVINSIKEDINNSSNNNHSRILFDGFKYFDKKYGEYIVIFYEKSNTTFNNKLKYLIKNDVYDYFNFNDSIKNKNEKEFVFEFIFSSLIHSYVYWYRHKSVMSLETFVHFANNIMHNGINSIIVNKK